MRRSAALWVVAGLSVGALAGLLREPFGWGAPLLFGLCGTGLVWYAWRSVRGEGQPSVGRGEVEESLRDELRPVVIESLRGELTEEVRVALRAELAPQVQSALRSELRPEIEGLLREEFHPQIEGALRAETRAAALQALRVELGTELRGEALVQLRRELEPLVRQRIEEELRPLIRADLRDRVEPQDQVAPPSPAPAPVPEHLPVAAMDASLFGQDLADDINQDRPAASEPAWLTAEVIPLVEGEAFVATAVTVQADEELLELEAAEPPPPVAGPPVARSASIQVGKVRLQMSRGNPPPAERPAPEAGAAAPAARQGPVGAVAKATTYQDGAISARHSIRIQMSSARHRPVP
jgi:hypothetical protein